VRRRAVMGDRACSWCVCARGEEVR
jgi:hypothetical protein